MLGGQAQRRAVGAQQAGVDELAHARLARRVDHRAVLRQALADFAGRDEQHTFGALEGGGQRGGAGVVGLAHLQAQGGQVGRLGRGAYGGDDLLRGHAAFDELGDDETAELAGGTGDDDHDVCSVGSGG